ncbi:MAG: ABC transporter permease, partial [Sporichthyaceae bacterium]|nr:ABC transporter permease [Sporichthyaceae bacterium]
MLDSTGRFARTSVQDAGYTVDLLLRTAGSIHYLPRRGRFLLDHAYTVGVRSLPVALVVALFAGMILALQTGIELRRFGQGTVIGTVTALTMCREMGPFITAVILAATVGSAMAAELGTMKVSEEITALEVISVDPVNYLVLPRVVALTVMCPIMTAFADFIGIFGGSIVGQIHLDVSATYYWTSVREALTSPDRLLPKDVYTGLCKALIFGCTVATVSCSAGIRATGGALGVGLAVQNAVKNSIILIIVLGYILTWFF